ncbi:LPS-assembly lipoprotein [Sphingomonas sp. OV641]|uniref:LPS assembly lipoprotein LptE n=1 Tax=Sphingomonas sp. OV641 TaxID=1881068 RepID=UPI0008B8D977|nr:LPS assembly lipoprotein LptE [Sphingomonas sp. OV641]SEJ65185.1 LPS-assembly lipoprotein [Sphingomonas sp. OV641]
MKRRLALAAGAAALLTLGGCGLKPLYSGGGSGAVASALGQVEVAPIEGKAGWLVTNALRDRLGAVPAGQTARYRLEIKLDDEITGLAIRRDDSVARERRTLRARYQLVELDRNGVVLDATAGSDAGIDVVGSDYATIAAESTALERLSERVADQILMRLAVYLGRTPTAP